MSLNSLPNLVLLALLQAMPIVPDSARTPSIRGSPESMLEQHGVALDHNLPFMQTEADILGAVAEGRLVELTPGADYGVADFVHLPYVIPEARLFVEQTAALYRRACGERLVVTSGVRAIADQPPNAHELSVHPAGMAVDLRVSANEACREWLESHLLALEGQGLLNGIREFRPPHYHVAVYPDAYRRYAEARAPTADREIEEPPPPGRRGVGTFVVLGVLLGVVVLLGWWMRRRRGTATADG